MANLKWKRNMNMDVKIPRVPPIYADNDDLLIICDLFAKEGEFVYKDQDLFCVESKNVVLEIVAPASGSIHSVEISMGEKVETDMLAMMLDPSTNEPLFKKIYRLINMEFLSGLMLGSIITYAILKVT